MGHAGFLGKWGGEREEKNSRKQRFKIFFFPASACAGKKLHRAVQNGTVQFFFFFKKKEKKFGSDPKMGYDNQHIISNLLPLVYQLVDMLTYRSLAVNLKYISFGKGRYPF